MGKKRSCRMTSEEREMHERAVKLKKMTDAQLCEFVDRIYGRGMEDGAKLTERSDPVEARSGAKYVQDFIEWLAGRIGSGNRIGNGTILQLHRELENAEKNGIFREGPA